MRKRIAYRACVVFAAAVAGGVAAFNPAQNQEPQRTDAAPWRFVTAVERKSLSSFLEVFDSGAVSLSIEINDGTGPSNQTSVANLGYLKIRNGNIVPINAEFARKSGAATAIVSTLQVKPIDPVDVAPGLRVAELCILPDATVRIELERARGSRWSRETMTLEPGQDDKDNRVFILRRKRGRGTRYRVLKDGGIQIYRRGWVDLTSRGKRVQTIALPEWPPTLPDLLSWLPEPKNAAVNQPVQRAGAPPRIPITKAELDFTGRIGRLAGNDSGPIKSVDNLDLHIHGAGFFDGTTFHAGAPGDLAGPGGAGAGLNTLRASFGLTIGEDNYKLPLRAKVEGAWQAAVPFYDLDSLSAALSFHIGAEGEFQLPKVDKDTWSLSPGAPAEVQLSLGGRTTLGRKTGAGGRDVTFQLDEDSRFWFRVPGPVELRINDDTGEGPVSMPEQTFVAVSAGKPVLEVSGNMSSRKYVGSSGKALGLGVNLELAFQTKNPIKLRHEASEEHAMTQIEPGSQIRITTGVASVNIGTGSGGDQGPSLDPDTLKSAQILPSSVAWEGSLRNTLIKTSGLDLRIPGLVRGSAGLEMKAPCEYDSLRLRDVRGRAEMALTGPEGARIVIGSPSRPTLKGAIQPEAYLRFDTGPIEGEPEERPTQNGFALRAGGKEGQDLPALTAKLLVRSDKSAPEATVLSGDVDADIAMTALASLFVPSGGGNYDGAFGFSGTVTLRRDDSKAWAGLQRIVLPLLVSGGYTTPKRDGK